MTRDAMQEAFQKDLSHLTWDEVYARQVKRADLVGEWMDALRLKKGDRVLEIGAGPGYVSLILADRVGPTGVIYAVDLSAEALAHLERRQKERKSGESLRTLQRWNRQAFVRIQHWSQWSCIMRRTQPEFCAMLLACFAPERWPWSRNSIPTAGVTRDRRRDTG